MIDLFFDRQFNPNLIEQMGYDEGTQQLKILFASGQLFQYEDVGPETYDELHNLVKPFLKVGDWYLRKDKIVTVQFIYDGTYNKNYYSILLEDRTVPIVVYAGEATADLDRWLSSCTEV